MPQTRSGIMKKKLILSAVLGVVAVIAAFTEPITVSGKGKAPKPGDPAFAKPLQSSALPPIPPKFGGVIKDTALGGSTPWWPPTIVPPKSAPNVLLIMTDDVGFG